MIDFKQRFAQYRTSPDGTGEYYFSNVRNGLIVGLVRSTPRASKSSCRALAKGTHKII